MVCILPISDLHVEFMPKKAKFNPAVLGLGFANNVDVVLVAGDTHPGVFGFEWLRKAFPNAINICVAGNHEFYSRSIAKHYLKMKDKAAEFGIIFLQNESVIIGGVKFIGATLWTDFSLMGNQPLAMFNAKSMMNDYKKIFVSYSHKVTPETILSQHKTSREFLELELCDVEFTGKKVVITHHAPSAKSVPSYYQHDLTSACYASNLDNLLSYFGPDVWHHGHTHTSFDYQIHNTRVICNPYGYHGEAVNNQFDPELLVEL